MIVNDRGIGNTQGTTIGDEDDDDRTTTASDEDNTLILASHTFEEHEYLKTLIGFL